MVVRSRLPRVEHKSAFAEVFGDYKMEGPNIKIDAPLKDLPSLGEITSAPKKKMEEEQQ
jgi:hypothetical protein